VRAAVRIVVLVVIFGASIVVGLASADVWQLTTGQSAAAVVVLALAALVQGLYDLVTGLSAEQRLRYERWVSETLKGTLVQVVQASGLDWKDVGINAFLVRRRPRWFGTPLLERVGRERIRNTPPPSNVVWTKGKGVIGRCWATATDQGVNLTALFGPADGLTEAEWLARSEEDRLGMTYADYQKTRYHGVVVATPILDRDAEVIGVVSADAPGDAFARLSNDEVREALGATATTLRNLLE
jgi:hypothetical protein